MAGTITFGGIGSGMDVEGIISGLMGVEKQPVSRLQSKQAAADSAVTELSNLGGLLSTLKSAATGLDTLQEVGSYKTTSSNTDAVAISATGNAQPGSYSIEVKQLAQASRRYTDAYSSANTALGESGTMTLQIGSNSANVDIESTDSLDAIIQKINQSGLRVQASSFFDGSKYRMSLRGLDTGQTNEVAISGLDLGTNKTANVVTKATDALIKVDGFEVTSSTNQINQALPGVNLAVKAVTTTPFNISITEDADGLATKLKTFVDSYNAVVNKLHTAAGFGKTKASNPLLAGDSAMRSIGSRLSGTMTQTVGTGAQNSLASIGIQLNNDGTLKLDQTKLSAALSTNSAAVTNVLAGNETTGTKGLMDMFRDLADNMLDPSKGTIATRSDGFQAQSKRYQDQIARENDRLTKMEERLRTTFTQMDSSVASSNALLTAVQKI